MELMFGLQKTSLLDFPGKISAVVFSYGCNLRCPFCHNPELVVEEPNEYLLSKNEIYAFLKSRVSKLDGVVFTGGEPLIHSDMLTFIKEIKDLGFFIKVDTNGFFPDRLERLIEAKIVDYFAMDIKSDRERYQKTIGLEKKSTASKTIDEENFVDKSFSIGKVLKSVELIMESGVEYEFRATFVPGLHDLQSAKGIGQLVEGAKKFYIQNFRSGKVIDSQLQDLGGFSELEIQRFKEILEEYVDQVIIRN